MNFAKHIAKKTLRARILRDSLSAACVRGRTGNDWQNAGTPLND